MATIQDHLTGEERIDSAFAAFIRRYPSYVSTERLDDLRATEYRRMDDLGQIYVDYTGGGLYAESQLRDHFALLEGHVFGNPHSSNPTSHASTVLVDEARASVLEFFNASPDEYAVVFTQNASGALKLIGEPTRRVCFWPSTRVGRAGTISWLTRLNPTFPACSIRSSGSTRPSTEVGTLCSTRRRSFRQIASI